MMHAFASIVVSNKLYSKHNPDAFSIALKKLLQITRYK